MSLFRRLVQMRVRRIDADRWDRIRLSLRPDERPINYTPVKKLGTRVLDGYLYLTSQALHYEVEERGGRPGSRRRDGRRIVFDDIGGYTYETSPEPHADIRLSIVIPTAVDEPQRTFWFDLFPGPISAALVEELHGLLHERG